MEPQPNFSASGDQSGAIVCTQCGAPMPKEMRFCRSCGNRLGEGPAEYTETVRLPHATATANGQFTNQYAPGMAAPMTRQTGGGYPSRKKRLGFSGMTWMWIILGIFFAGGGLMSAYVKNARNVPRIGAVTSSRSYVGVDGFETTDGGATFDVVEPPGSPADKAGMVGGDIVTSFDGHAITDDDQIMDLLRQTPVGKTVEVIFLRDGVIKKAQLTTISEGGFNQLREAFSGRPEGKGLFGFESDQTTRINDPATKTYGVRMDHVQPNGPADLFGIKEGDIITDFDTVPIRTEDELLSRVRRAIPYSTVEVVVLRGSLPDRQTVKIPVKIGRAR
jgi:membrane-associated protease RseP (regulator of RpoE activity)